MLGAEPPKNMTLICSAQRITGARMAAAAETVWDGSRVDKVGETDRRYRFVVVPTVIVG